MSNGNGERRLKLDEVVALVIDPLYHGTAFLRVAYTSIFHQQCREHDPSIAQPSFLSLVTISYQHVRRRTSRQHGQR